MGKVGEARILGGVGSLLVLLAFVPYLGPVLAIAGFVLILVAVKYISDYLQDKAIFKNMIIAVMSGVLGVVAAVLIIFASIFTYTGFHIFTFTNMGVPRPLSGEAWGLLFPAAILLALLAVWALYVVSAIFLRRSFNSIATKLNVGLFGTTALLYLLGAVLTIVLIGFLLIFIAQILQLIAFLSVAEQPTQLSPPSQSFNAKN
jgi:uncharacterized membrane protein